MTQLIGHKGGSASTPVEAPDSLHSVATAKILDLLCEGPIQGLAHGLQSVYLNETPLANADGTLNFERVAVDVRTGTQEQQYIAGFPAAESEIAVGVELRGGNALGPGTDEQQLVSCARAPGACRSCSSRRTTATSPATG